ncbi:hypothetical protein [Undibacterium crateris]|uniref:hypothetical protein n=1 Tax=Undibacterium crateris TaxID=2528175 RepID=UPI001389D47D|nr:hypothetical protein [Undibacterium crateris]NDI84623.1 hypothetical protein [Undibacterium crateris]
MADPTIQQIDNSSASPSHNFWTYTERVIKAIAWIAVSLALLFHFTGEIAQQSYSERLGIKGSLFEKSLFQIEIKGMLSVMGTFAESLPSPSTQNITILIMLVIALCAGLLFSIYIWLNQKYPEKTNIRKKLVMQIEGKKSPFKKFLYATAIFFTGEMLLIPGPILFVAFLCLPILIFGNVATNYGRNEAARDLKDFQQPCNESRDYEHYCATLQKPNQAEIKGFLIDSSDKYVAIYEEKTKQIRISELKDATIILSSINGKNNR